MASAAPAAGQAQTRNTHAKDVPMTLPPSEVHRMARDFGGELRKKCAVAPAAFAMIGPSDAERRAVMSPALSDVVCAFGQSLGLRSRDTLREIDTALDRARRLLEQAG